MAEDVHEHPACPKARAPLAFRDGCNRAARRAPVLVRARVALLALWGGAANHTPALGYPGRYLRRAAGLASFRQEG